MQCTIIFYTKRTILAKRSGEPQPQKENAETGPSTERLQQSIFLLNLTYMAVSAHACPGSVIFSFCTGVPYSLTLAFTLSPSSITLRFVR